MALILGVSGKKGFYINDIPVRVLRRKGLTSITLTVRGKTFEVTDKEAVEIYPQVFVSCGVSPTNDNDFPRLVIDAPKEIVILRDRLWEKTQAHAG